VKRKNGKLVPLKQRVTKVQQANRARRKQRRNQRKKRLPDG
jgi:hypothetical protein